MNRHALLFTLAVVATTPAAEAADIGSKLAPLRMSTEDLRGSSILAANNQVTASFVETSTFYMERSAAGVRYDSERGWLPGLAISASVMENWGVDDLYLFGQFKWVNATTTYTGAYIGGTYGDLVQKSGASTVNVDFRVGKGFAIFDGTMLTPYAGLGWRNWTRTLTGAGGYREDYRHGYFGAGAMVQYAPVEHWVIGLSGLVGRTFSAEMATTPTPGGAAVPADKFRLGASTLFMAGASVDYAMTSHAHVGAGVDYVGHRYGASAANIYGMYEPDSRTDEVTMKVGLGYSF